MDSLADRAMTMTGYIPLIVQVIAPDLKTVVVQTSVKELQMILHRSLNLMPDIPPHWLAFSDAVDDIDSHKN